MEDIHAYLHALQPFSGEIDILFDEIMARHTTFRIGGPAEVFLSPKSIDAFGKCIGEANRQRLPYAVIGNGSNLLIHDEGVQGIVICTGELREMQVSGVQIQVQAGALLSQVAKLALTYGLTGFEFAAGIPGSIGGAVFMNAGAYDGQMAQVVTQVQYLDENGQAHTLSGAQCAFGYRDSIFRRQPHWSVAAVTLTLQAGEAEQIEQHMADLAARRREKQPLNYPSAGSTFKRPAGHFAGALIEQAGLKGHSIGGAQVSEKHAGFLINRGGASYGEVQALIALVQQTVQASSGVLLECEVQSL